MCNMLSNTIKIPTIGVATFKKFPITDNTDSDPLNFYHICPDVLAYSAFSGFVLPFHNLPCLLPTTSHPNIKPQVILDDVIFDNPLFIHAIITRNDSTLLK